jgi:hypothetical protein
VASSALKANLRHKNTEIEYGEHMQVANPRRFILSILTLLLLVAGAYWFISGGKIKKGGTEYQNELPALAKDIIKTTSAQTTMQITKVDGKKSLEKTIITPDGAAVYKQNELVQLQNKKGLWIDTGSCYQYAQGVPRIVDAKKIVQGFIPQAKNISYKFNVAMNGDQIVWRRQASLPLVSGVANAGAQNKLITSAAQSVGNQRVTYRLTYDKRVKLPKAPQKVCSQK